MDPWSLELWRLGQHTSALLSPPNCSTGVFIWLMAGTTLVAVACAVVLIANECCDETQFPSEANQHILWPPERSMESLTPREIVLLLHRSSAIDMAAGSEEAFTAYVTALRGQLHKWECQPAKREAPQP